MSSRINHPNAVWNHKSRRLTYLLAPFILSTCFVFARAGDNVSSKLPAVLEPLIQSYPKPVDDALKGLARSIRLFEEGRYGAALEQLPGRDGAATTALGDYFLLYRAKANLALDRADEALGLFQLLLKEYPSWPLLPDSILGECQAMLKLHRASAARSVLENAALNQSAETLYWQGRVEEEAGEARKATDLYLRVYTDYVGSKQSFLAEERLLALSPRSLKGQSGYANVLHRAENLLSAGMNREAQSLLIRLGRVPAPDRSSGDLRYVLLAQAETGLGKATTVLPYLNKVGDSDPTTHAHAIYLKAVCYRRLKREESFLEMRDLALRLYPQSQFTERLLYSVATYFDVAGRLKEARTPYQQIADRFPNASDAERALWKLAFYSYLDHNYEEALSGFWKYLKTYPGPRSAASPMYWMGRCYERLGDRASALAVYQRASALANHSYYGRLSAQAGSALQANGAGSGPAMSRSIDFSQVSQVLETIRPSAGAIPQPSEAATLIIERVRQLASAGLTDLALSEVRRGIRRYPDEKGLSYLSSRLCFMRKDYEGVFVALRHAFPDYDGHAFEDLPEEVWEMLFPFEHWSVVNSQAARNRVDPALVLGVIRQESAFLETARSRQNALGLMQVLPGTGRILARQSGVRYTVPRLFRADTNIILGTKYLAALIRQYGGKEELALAAYNAGDQRVDQWMGRFGNVDMAEFVERIPFSETRGYVKQVLTNRAYYSVLKDALGDTRIAQIAGPEIESADKPAPRASSKAAKPATKKATSKTTRRSQSKPKKT